MKKKAAKHFRRALKRKPSLQKKKTAPKKARRRPVVAARKSVAKKVSQKKPVTNAEFSPQTFFKAKIRVIGIGGGGGSIVSEIGRSLGKATFVAADTDMRSFKKRPGIKQFLFGQELTHGLGTGLNVDLARAAAESEKEKIAKLFEGQDIVIFIASLGGGLGSGATQVFAEAAKHFGGISFGIFTLPFKFEGKNKYAIALKSLRQLRRSLNVSITIPNERIFKIIEANTAITDAFSIVNRTLIESLESLIDLIYAPGIINIDFADLKAILSGTGNLAFLNTVEASGQDRAEKIARKVLHNALYQSNNFTVQKVLFNIASSGSVSMLEVDKISRVIADHNKHAKIIFGISKDPSLKQKIKTTLLMTGVAADAVKPAPVKIPVPPVVKPIKVAPKKQKTPVAVPAAPVAKKKPAKQVKKPVRLDKKPVPPRQLVPVFAPELPMPAAAVSVGANHSSEDQKKAIRRTALEAKEVQAQEENRKSEQEKEWEIPAFLRKIKKV